MGHQSATSWPGVSTAFSLLLKLTCACNKILEIQKFKGEINAPLFSQDTAQEVPTTRLGITSSTFYVYITTDSIYFYQENTYL